MSYFVSHWVSYSVLHCCSYLVSHCCSYSVEHWSSYLVSHFCSYLVSHCSSYSVLHCCSYLVSHCSWYSSSHCSSYLVSHFCSYSSSHFSSYLVWHSCSYLVSHLSSYLVVHSLSSVQVNFYQKHLFFHQLTHNMTKDCSLSYKFSTWKLQAQNMPRTCCVHKLFWMLKQKTICVHNMFLACCEHVLSLQFSSNEQSVVILCVSWCKNKSFWQRFTCTIVADGLSYFFLFALWGSVIALRQG